jgi:hypothetical protein
VSGKRGTAWVQRELARNGGRHGTRVYAGGSSAKMSGSTGVVCGGGAVPIESGGGCGGVCREQYEPVWSSIVMLIFVSFTSTSRITPTTITCVDHAKSTPGKSV